MACARRVWSRIVGAGLLLAAIARCAYPAGAASQQPHAPAWYVNVPGVTPQQRPGTPTYDETVAWLVTHTEAKGRALIVQGDRIVSVSIQFMPTRIPCVLAITHSFMVASRRTVRRETFYLLSLNALNAESTHVNDIGGVELRGGEGLVIELDVGDTAITEKGRKTSFILPYASAEDGGRAAKALANAAALCGATATAEPF